MRTTRTCRRGAGWGIGLGALLALTSLPVGLGAQPAPRVAPARTATAAVLQAERELLTAMTRRDARGLDRLLAPDFALVSALSTGEVIPRADWIAGLLERRSADSGSLTSPEVRMHAPGVATVVARVTWTSADGGPTPQREEYLVTDTWVRRGRTWVLAARHSSTRRSAP